MENREDFIGRLREGVYNIDKDEFYRQNEKGQMNPKKKELIEGYRTYISDLGEGFLKIVEQYNECIKIAKKNELIGNTQVKARIKDYSSSAKNTEKKKLDDVFGMEVVTANEREKEILMLFVHLLSVIQNDKKYNKESGYVAYHCTADFSPNRSDISKDNIKNIIKNIIENSTTKEYLKSPGDKEFDEEKHTRVVSVYPELKREILEKGKLTKLSMVLGEMLKLAKTLNLKPESIPVVEYHFLTSAVEAEAIRGKASHDVYKGTDAKKIAQFFSEGRLLRGINAPWKFIANENGLVLQDYYETLKENWPFLTESIVKRRKLGKEEKDKAAINTYDKLSAFTFEFLGKYVGQDKEYTEEQKEKSWEALLLLISRNTINMDTKDEDIIPLDEVLDEMLEGEQI